MPDRKIGYVLVAFFSALLLCVFSLFAVGKYQADHGAIFPLPTALTPMQTSLPTVPAPPSAVLPGNDYMHPIGIPLEKWNGIPIMPRSLNGQEFSDGGYSYTAEVLIEDVQNYYLRELSALGWQLFDEGFVEKGAASIGIFEKGGHVLNVTIAPDVDVDTILVVILHLQ